jgi:hypothetical protein
VSDTPSAEPRSADMLLAVLGVQLGYLSAEDALAAARELAQPTERRTLSEFLVARGVLDRARAQVLERLAARAAAVGGGDAAQTLELLPSSVRQLAKDSVQALPRTETRVDLVDEQPHRYFAAPRADQPPAELGRGEFGRVLLMHDTVIGRDVAWREPRSPSSEADAQLVAEARQLAGLDHPAVVPVYEAGRGARGAYVTQRRVGQRTLADGLIDARGLDERLALLPALLVVAQCLAKAHERGVTHRALSCARVSMGRFGEVYVLGWGPPVPEAERAEGVKLDVRGLGAILHEIITGLPPPVMGLVQPRGAPDDLLGLCRGALAGQGSAEQFAQELKAFIDGRRLGSYRYSSWQLLKRYVQRHRLFSAMALAAFLLVMVGASVVSMRVAGERDRARLFARLFLDDVALRLRAQPGVEPLLERVTAAALQHYERTTELRAAPREERLRVARAMTRLGSVSLSLGRADEASKSFDFARGLVTSLPAGDPEADVVLAELTLARALAPDSTTVEREAAAGDARALADRAAARLPDSFEARRLGAVARVVLARLATSPAIARVLFDDGVQRLESPARDVADELLRRQTLGQALVERASTLGADADALREVVARLATLRERALDDLELQVAAARAALLLAEALEGRDVEGQHAQAEAALQFAREASARRPDKPDYAVLEVRAALLAGRPTDALAAARGFEARGVSEVAPWTAEAALFSGDFEQARALAARAPVASSPRMVLVRALASAWLERPSDAVIQARALRASFGAGPWPAARLALALEPLPRGTGAGEATVRAFAAQWRDEGGAPAIAQLIATLEAALRP